jgi:hypothetical protein
MAVQPEISVDIVQDADNMSTEIFCLHMTHRHSDSLGGMSELNPLVQSDYTEELWRIFHDKLHDRKLFPFREVTHEHER